MSAHWTSTGTPPRSDIQVRERQTSQTDRSDSVTVQKESYSRTDSLIVIMCVRQVCPTCPPPLREYVLLQAAEESDTSKEPNTLDTTGTSLTQNLIDNDRTRTIRRECRRAEHRSKKDKFQVSVQILKDHL